MSGPGRGGAGANLTVAVRVRPLNAKERARASHSCLVCQDGTQINVIDPDEKMGGIDYLRLDRTKDKSYAFDHAFDASVGQAEVFAGTAARVVPDVLRGGNACVFAYGATGSGKTFTMMGAPDAPGVVLRTTDALFEAAAADEEHSTAVTMQ
jgi:kinesin family protein 18/19